MKLEWLAGIKLECMTGFVGICREADEEIGVRPQRRRDGCGWRIPDADRDFEKAQPDRDELSPGQIAQGRDGLAQGLQQPVAGGVKHQADLVGDGSSAGGAVGSEMGLVRLDQVFGPRRARCRSSSRLPERAQLTSSRASHAGAVREPLSERPPEFDLLPRHVRGFGPRAPPEERRP